mmetsp:Transcript_9375/g.12334  ORF Transcript_9375/g.12334 Transcript_9375/m.12334 type:complete len:208 (-) Transcript_9375:363-986(-)
MISARFIGAKLCQAVQTGIGILCHGRRPGYDGPTASSLLMQENNLLRSYDHRDHSPVTKKKGKKAENAFKDQLLEKSINTVQALEEKLDSAMAESKAAIIKGAVWFGKNANILLDELGHEITSHKEESTSQFQKTASVSSHPLVLAEMHASSMGQMEEAVRSTREQISQMITDLDYAGKLRDMKRFDMVKNHMPIKSVDNLYDEDFH